MQEGAKFPITVGTAKSLLLARLNFAPLCNSIASPPAKRITDPIEKLPWMPVDPNEVGGSVANLPESWRTRV
jgi:hypothetical protein